ncbi:MULTISPECIES: PASTA domain-containing protein [unclassified Blastococcus]
MPAPAADASPPAAETIVRAPGWAPAPDTSVRPLAWESAQPTVVRPPAPEQAPETVVRAPGWQAAPETVVRAPGWESAPETVVRAPGWQAAPETVVPEPPAPKRRRVTWKRVALTGVTVVLVGVFGSGFGSGVAFEGSVGDREPADEVTVEVAKAPSANGDVVPLPDVRGLALTDAQQAMTDAGLDLGVVTAEDTPSALPAGTVVTQDPVGGTEGAERVTLFVAVPGVVPDLVGRTADDARTALVALGTRYQQDSVYQPGAAEGTVLAVTPPAGSPLSGTVTVTVAGAPAGVFLSDLEAIEGGCSVDEVPINGTTYADSIYCSVGQRPTTTTYLLNRLTTSLQVTVGITDGSDPNAAAHVVVYGDGRVLAVLDPVYGQSAPLDLPTAGVLRLDIEYSTTVEGSTVRLGFGDARVVGAPQDIETLDAE